MKASSWIKRAVLITVITLAVLAGLLVGHPWIFGFPGRVGEWAFQLGLHTGMTRAQVVHLAKITDNEVYTFPNGTVQVEGIDFATICLAGGKHFVVRFDSAGRVTRWKVSDYGDGC